MNLKLKLVIVIFIFAIAILLIFAFAKKEKKERITGEVSQIENGTEDNTDEGEIGEEIITGEIRIVGTSLFYDLVITTEERDYYFDKEFFEEYAKYEGEIITIEAKVKKTKLWLADRSRYLERYNILSVKKVD